MDLVSVLPYAMIDSKSGYLRQAAGRLAEKLLPVVVHGASNDLLQSHALDAILRLEAVLDRPWDFRDVPRAAIDRDRDAAAAHPLLPRHLDDGDPEAIAPQGGPLSPRDDAFWSSCGAGV